MPKKTTTTTSETQKVSSYTFSQTTLDIFHEIYNNSVRKPHTRNLIDVLDNIKQEISSYTFPVEDIDNIDIFLRNLESSIRTRKKTFTMTNFISDVVFTMLYIAIWLNQSHKLDIDVNLSARRKSLESELTKLLTKSEIHDRFGIRGIELNNDSEDDSKETDKLNKYFRYTINILTHTKRISFDEFYTWVTESKQIDPLSKSKIFYILEIPFKVVDITNYINQPKLNGYQSLHSVLQVEMFSDVLPGAEFELQLRTTKMHQNAIHGEASHLKYKNSTKESVRNVFRIDSFDDLKLAGFTSYDSSDDDLDGVHCYKSFANRRVSVALVNMNN